MVALKTYFHRILPGLLAATLTTGCLSGNDGVAVAPHAITHLSFAYRKAAVTFDGMQESSPVLSPFDANTAFAALLGMIPGDFYGLAGDEHWSVPAEHGIITLNLDTLSLLNGIDVNKSPGFSVNPAETRFGRIATTGDESEPSDPDIVGYGLQDQAGSKEFILVYVDRACTMSISLSFCGLTNSGNLVFPSAGYFAVTRDIINEKDSKLSLINPSNDLVYIAATMDSISQKKLEDRMNGCDSVTTALNPLDGGWSQLFN